LPAPVALLDSRPLEQAVCKRLWPCPVAGLAQL